MITFSSLEPFALSSLILVAVLGKLGKLGKLGICLSVCLYLSRCCQIPDAEGAVNILFSAVLHSLMYVGRITLP